MREEHRKYPEKLQEEHHREFLENRRMIDRMKAQISDTQQQVEMARGTLQETIRLRQELQETKARLHRVEEKHLAFMRSARSEIEGLMADRGDKKMDRLIHTSCLTKDWNRMGRAIE